jgi:hypothetical protein
MQCRHGQGWHGEPGMLPGSWVEWRRGRYSLRKQETEMPALHDTRMGLTDQANKSRLFIERNQAAANGYEQGFWYHALGLKGIRIWRGSDNAPQCIDCQLRLGMSDPKQHKFGESGQLGFLGTNPLPCPCIDGLNIRWKCFYSLFDIESTDTVAERFQLELRKEEPVSNGEKRAQKSSRRPHIPADFLWIVSARFCSRSVPSSNAMTSGLCRRKSCTCNSTSAELAAMSKS